MLRLNSRLLLVKLSVLQYSPHRSWNFCLARFANHKGNKVTIVNRHVICSTTIFNNAAKPLMSVKFLVNGTHTTSHKYRFGENLTVDCQVVGLPVPTVTWSHGQQLITPSARRKVGLRMTDGISFLNEREDIS